MDQNRSHLEGQGLFTAVLTQQDEKSSQSVHKSSSWKIEEAECSGGFSVSSLAKEKDIQTGKLEADTHEFRTDENMVPEHLTALNNIYLFRSGGLHL